MVSEAAVVSSPTSRLAFGPWLFGARVDLSLFLGSAVLALLLVALGHLVGLGDDALPEWGFLAFVLAIDVAHVYATLFRTYLDREELCRHPLRYALVPVGSYLVGVALHLSDSLTFWRVLAYAALFHFVRQQVGWVAVYRARGKQRGRVDRLLDDAAIYAATLYPVIEWHAHLAQTRFAWFIKGDFVDLGSVAASSVTPARALWAIVLFGFCLRQVMLARQSGVLELGKIVVVLTTAAVWYVGIVVMNSDFDFTVTNVIAHGVPYMALLWVYSRERAKEAPKLVGSQIVAGGVGAFLGLLLLLAFLEELVWDRLVFRDHEWLFGAGGLELGPLALSLVVPLLAVPQATHYVLDGLLWRQSDTRTRPAQRKALGFAATGPANSP